MKKGLIIVLISVVALAALGAGAWFFIRDEGAIPSGGAGLSADEGESHGAALSDTDRSSFPSGETLTIGTPAGAVTVKNFYLGAARIVEGSELVLKETDAYTISYLISESVFYITAAKNSAVESAEAALVALLGISRSDACKLASVVAIPIAPGDPRSGKSYPLSFCGSVVR